MGQECGGVGTGHSSTAANRNQPLDARESKLRRNSAVTNKNGNTGLTFTVAEQGGQGTTYSPNAKTRRLAKPWLPYSANLHFALTSDISWSNSGLTNAVCVAFLMLCSSWAHQCRMDQHKEPSAVTRMP